MALRWRVLIAVSIVVIAVDQWSKFMVVKHLTPGLAQAHYGTTVWGGAPTGAKRDAELGKLGFFEEVRYFYSAIQHPCGKPGAVCREAQVIDGFWSWRYVENPGAAWGLLSDTSESIRRPFFVVVSLVAVAFIIGFVRRIQDGQRLLLLSLALVLGGAIGNFIDRLHLSYVIDFVDWYAGRHHWPTFNIADVAITSGVGLMLLDAFVNRDALEEPETEATATPSPEESS